MIFIPNWFWLFVLLLSLAPVPVLRDSEEQRLLQRRGALDVKKWELSHCRQAPDISGRWIDSCGGAIWVVIQEGHKWSATEETATEEKKMQGTIHDSSIKSEAAWGKDEATWTGTMWRWSNGFEWTKAAIPMWILIASYVIYTYIR